MTELIFSIFLRLIFFRILIEFTGFFSLILNVFFCINMFCSGDTQTLVNNSIKPMPVIVKTQSQIQIEVQTQATAAANPFQCKQERGKALRQVVAAFIANLGTINTGLVFGFSAVVIPQLKREDSLIQIDESQASWIGKFVLFLVYVDSKTNM